MQVDFMLILRSPFCLEGGSKLARGYQAFKKGRVINPVPCLVALLGGGVTQGTQQPGMDLAWAESWFVCRQPYHPDA